MLITKDVFEKLFTKIIENNYKINDFKIIFEEYKNEENYVGLIKGKIFFYNI
jgi:hypothetical protein